MCSYKRQALGVLLALSRVERRELLTHNPKTLNSKPYTLISNRKAAALRVLLGACRQNPLKQGG